LGIWLVIFKALAAL